jgi:hypothetical protein
MNNDLSMRASPLTEERFERREESALVRVIPTKH